MRGRRATSGTGCDDDGFTLIELLVVMIIIGILAAIAIPVYVNQQNKGYDAGLKGDLRSVANELQTYYVDNQTYFPAYGWGTTSGAVAMSPQVSFLTDRAHTNPVGATQYVGADTISLSTGSYITYMAGGSNGFCLRGTSYKDNSTFYYDSLAGGLQSRGGSTCTGSGY